MKPTSLFSLALVATTQLLGVYAASKTSGTDSAPSQTPSTTPIVGQLTSHGCYKSGGNLTQAAGVKFVSSGSCGKYCTGKGYYVMGLHAAACYCGMVYPPLDDVTDDSKCDYPCPGYDPEACGSLKNGVFSVFNTGVEVAAEDMEPESSSSTTAAASSTKESTKSTAAETAVATSEPAAASSTGSSSDGDKKKSTNTAAIAAGSVVGVIAVAGIIGVAVFFVRRRRNAEIEEEHRRNAAVNAFINGSKPPGSSGSISMTDSRLDPVMAHRRLSDGSIADDQDYSRRILRVTNA
ncbi:hypothetical protein BGZ61DRAFT_532699 [Ilyonectria robusta]|uniref:uncharacterized protein n=1 Tax=Ilyonectria robusta TaxID=1079257 RepID=UPI001E8E1F3A|nr:uncharacterized protein BGZ61DRAFT_532699 [Ilyonectria robusta]KAH8694649.1 hypothetical protein BGZ61DRAFT_532699 [Ilyonectria robusta]